MYQWLTESFFVFVQRCVFLDKAVAVGNMKHLRDKYPETAVDKAADKYCVGDVFEKMED